MAHATDTVRVRTSRRLRIPPWGTTGARGAGWSDGVILLPRLLLVRADEAAARETKMRVFRYSTPVPVLYGNVNLVIF